MTDNDKQQSAKEHEDDRTPGAAGHPEPGSGHDDSKTATVDDDPPINQAARTHGSPRNREES